MKNRLILLAVNSRYSHSNPALYSLKASCSDLTWDITIIERTIHSPVEETFTCIEREMPHALGLSVFIWNRTYILKLVELLRKKLPGIRLIAGGPEVSWSLHSWLNTGVHFVVPGPGEEALRQLLKDKLNKKESIVSAANPHFDALPFLYENHELQELKKKYIYYETSRGCPRSCSYCLSGRHETSLELRSHKKIFHEIDTISAVQPLIVKFIDRTFNAKKSHYRPIWEYLITTHGRGNTVYHSEIQPDLLNDDDFALLRTAPRGLFQFEAGIQSLDKNVLSKVNRSMDVPLAIENCHRIIDLGTIHLHVDQIIGLPGENPASAMMSFNGIYSIGAHHFQPGFLKVLPGSHLAEENRQHKHIIHKKEPPYEVIATNLLPEDFITEMKSAARFVDLVYNNGGFPMTCTLLMELFPAPLHIYRYLAQTHRTEKMNPITEWHKTAALIIAAVKKYSPETSSALLDTLRWDWFSSGRNHRYPANIQGELLARARKQVKKLIKTKTGPEPLLQWASQGKPYSVFQAESSWFTNNNLTGEKTAVYFNGSIHLLEE